MAWRLLLAWLILVLVAPATARAHAIILESSPAVDATVPGPDVPVILRFNSRIDRERSSVSLAATAEAAHPQTLTLAPTDSPDILKTTAAGLAPGSYTLRWQVLSVDGHITRGDIPFKVAR